MKKAAANVIKSSLLLLSLGFVGGCDLLKKKESPAPHTTHQSTESHGSVLCTINGESAVTESEFMNNLTQMMQSNPYFRGASIDSLPKELLRKFLEQLTTQSLIEKFSIKNNVEKDPEFIKAYNETEKLLKRSLMVQMFEKKIYDGLNVSNSDIDKYYKENKDRFIKVAGGSLAMGVRFETDDAAHAFLTKAKNNIDDFEKIAKDAKDGKFKDFGRVSKESRSGQPGQYDAVPGAIKDAIDGIRKFPHVEKVKNGKEFWVIKAWDKKDAVAFELEEVKQHIEAMLKNNLFRDALEKRVNDLKGQFTIVVNEEYFKEKSQPGHEVGHHHEEADEDEESTTSTAA